MTPASHNRNNQDRYQNENPRIRSRFPEPKPYNKSHYKERTISNQDPINNEKSVFHFNISTVAILAGVLVVGIGIGTGISSTSQGSQGNIASSQQLDMAVADPEFCKQWGASAFVMDLQTYTTMNPSTSFVSQPKLQPGCVIRRENWSVLQKEGVVSAEQMRECKQRMNTFAYIGSVRDKPEVRCVYQTDLADNKFHNRGIANDMVSVSPESNKF
uniref:DUF3172 domain-containing protein n=1 Tax=Paulinella chromatophora TaxID=39717 RepID=B1X488_PAUCH|nr:hypothetical protein PCC_0316 [Paulinella chromatophora]ACB42757.1 hypothetical protein PCC_0316 [Paulinella chromatophora]